MSVRLNGSTSGYVELDAPAVAGNNVLRMPTSNGSARQVLMTDGAGNLSFVNDDGALYYRLNADFVGANVTTAQNIFGVGVTLAAGTVYVFDGLYTFYKTAGTGSHTMGFGFGGTATVNNVIHSGGGVYGVDITIPNADTSPASYISTSLANQTATGSFANSNCVVSYLIRGTVSINAGGTFVPQYTLSAAPGAVWTVSAGSYIRLIPIGAAGSNSSQGTWS